MFAKVEKAVTGISYVLVILFTVAMVVTTFLQVFFRYALDSPLYWSEELSRFFFVWIVFIGTSIAAKEGAHIGVDYFVRYLPERMRIGVSVALNLGAIAFLFVVITEAIPVVRVNMGQHSPAVGVPMGIVYLAIPIGFAFTLFHLVVQSIRIIRSGAVRAEA